MGEDDRINFTGRNGEVLPVALSPLFLSLEETAVDEYLNSLPGGLVASVDQVLRSGYDSSGAQKLDVAQFVLVTRKPRRYIRDGCIVRTCVLASDPYSCFEVCGTS
jgi:hypothetical protein